VTHGLDTSFLVAVEVSCHAAHGAARTLASSLREKGGRFALTPQVIAEFVHIVTDPKRFTAPLTMAQALERVQVWWDAPDVERVWPDESAVSWFFSAMTKHELGRKRVLDTLLAGVFLSADISSLLTLNATDFAEFGDLTCLTCVPLAAPTAQAKS